MGKKIKIDPRTITLNELKEALSKVLVTSVGTEPRDNQKIEGEQENVHYQITKEFGLKHPEIICYVLRVWGISEDGRQGLIGDFIRLLGSPVREFPAKNPSDYDCLFWNVKEVD